MRRAMIILLDDSLARSLEATPCRPTSAIAPAPARLEPQPPAWTTSLRGRPPYENEAGGPKTARHVVIRPSRCPNPSEVYVWPAHRGALTPGGPMRPVLAEERQNALARLVRLRQHRSAGLLQDLELRELDHLAGHVHVADAALGGGQVLLVDGRVLERVPETVLHRAELRALRAHGVDGGIDLGDVGRACGSEREVARANARTERDQRDGDDLAVLSTDLEGQRLSGVQQLDAVEVRRRADPLDLRSELVHLGLDGRAVVARQRAVLVLHRQVTDAVKHRVDLGQRALGRLHQRHCVLRVALSLVETADLATEALADREAGGVIGCTVDPVAARKPLHRGRELVLGTGEVPVRVESFDVVLNTKGHRSSSLMNVLEQVPGNSLSPLSDRGNRPLLVDL